MRLTPRLAIALILALTLYRIVLLTYGGTDLFVDEAQYWLWSQHLDFGYYSKPPMIAWVIHLTTLIGASESIFWVRVASPLFHMATALILIPAANRLTNSEKYGPWVGLSFATLPGVALSSVFMSTDTILFPFLALALLCYAHLIERKSAGFALLMGIAIGLGTLSKYAMLYFAGITILSAIFLPKTRIALRDTVLAAFSAILVILPNIWWNATHGDATLKHTSENADWHGLNFHIGKAGEFLASQFGVIGPVLFAALLIVFYRLVRGRTDTTEKHLFLLSWPIILVIVFQALMSRAYANWAATAYAAGTILAVYFLARNAPKALLVSLVINGIASLAFPVMAVYADKVTLPNGTAILHRYLGRSEMSRTIADIAARSGTHIIVADDRDILADLFYTLRNGPFTLRAATNGGFPKNYYEQEYPLTAVTDIEPVLYITERQTLTCNGAVVDPVSRLHPQSGNYRKQTFNAYVIPASCLTSRLT
ncbi:glycosyltransferase family 39 protein [Allorhizobium sp. BGMRC 0089]|uniref:ArnT family glycosyltransferase n=1 Tax=Allorhizobium sonneratiae TaxID=2934936 RepID=UPI0020343C23|nr:glycosyltransferase family 39 protein [Allorhizobium sonneratiae]MCM2294295.1 glycosyltransferase family 39 protein [Allorhizobium sonneratiae]